MMKKLSALLLVLGFFGVSAAAAADCAAIGQKVANEQSGKLARADKVVKDGKDMCVIVVLVPPGRDGEKPRRVEVAVPAN